MTGTENRTELGNARRLVQRHGAHIRFVHAWGKWLVFQDGRWTRDATGEIERLAKETVLSIYAEAQAADSDAERQQLAAHAVRSERASQIRAMIELATSEPGVAVTPDELDADPWFLNVVNGTLDLRTETLRPHDAHDLLTKQMPVAFDPTATCPQWEAFLDTVMDRRPELIAYVQRCIGYALTGRRTEQVLLFLYGTGANGKTTAIEVLRALAGDYAANASFSTFLERRGDGARNDLARLAGARVVTASEAGEGARLDEGLIKTLTGGDSITARFLYGENFEFRPSFVLMLVANHRPEVRGTDHAIWRRVHVVPFTVRIAEPDRDPDLSEKLKAELPGILRWAVEGCLAWQREGLNPPPIVRMATEDYRQEMDVVGSFLDARCRLSTSGRIGATRLYEAYKSWAQETGERAISQRRFGERLAERGLVRVKASTTNWLGLELIEGGREGEPPILGTFPYVSSRGKNTEKGPVPSHAPALTSEKVAS